MSVYSKYEVEFERFTAELGFVIETTNFYLGCLQHKDYQNLVSSYISFAYKYNKTHYIVTLYNAETDMTLELKQQTGLSFV